jgi:dTDP-4-dehydrorhamnose 3,5-epimerase
MSSQVRNGTIPGISIIEFPQHKDIRGTFQKVFSQFVFDGAGHEFFIRQVNYSMNPEVGILRGLHYQASEEPEKKVIHCIQGGIFDVIVDLRKGSPTFMRWESYEMESGQSKIIMIPAGCAHGFQTTKPDTIILYLHTAEYAENKQFGLNALDPKLGIKWPTIPAKRSASDEARPFIQTFWEGLPS